MTKRHGNIFFFILAIFFLISPTSSANAADNAEVTDIHADQGEGYLNVRFRLQNCFTPEMEEAIWSGVPTTFRILIILEEPGLPLFRKRLLDVVLEHTIKYDLLKNVFRVHCPEATEKLRTTTSIEEAKTWMSTVSDLSLTPLWRLEKGEQYRLYVKAELSKVDLPLFFRYVLFFVSLWDFETDWQSITITP